MTSRITRHSTKCGGVIDIPTYKRSTLHNILGVSESRLLYFCMVRVEDEETVDSRTSNTKTPFYNILSMLKKFTSCILHNTAKLNRRTAKMKLEC